MKKQFLIYSVVLFVLLAGCYHGEDDPQSIISNFPVIADSVASSHDTDTAFEDTVNDVIPTEAEETTQEPETNVVDTPEDTIVETYESTADIAMPDVPSVGDITQNGYAVERIDGIYYIGGILVVNKTYPLPASFAPGGLQQCAYDALGQMQLAAAKENLSLWCRSGYRSYADQKYIYNGYVADDGVEAADTYSARPGHSEHQSGLALDMNMIALSFADTPEGKWIAEHCWEFGFIIRYPSGKEHITGYMYEPWHIRYVGKEVAAEIHASGLCLEEYLGITSNYDDFITLLDGETYE